MLPITKDIETAMNRVKSSRNAYAELVKYANSFVSSEAQLHLGPPDPAEKSAQPVNTAAMQNNMSAKASHVPVSETVKQSAAVNSTPETTLPNQNKDLTISEFEIVPDKTPSKNTPKRNNQRRGGFGFNLSPIITVRRPNRP